jgi:hypothetical protein
LFNNEYDHSYRNDKTSCENERGLTAALNDHAFYYGNIPVELQKLVLPKKYENQYGLEEVVTYPAEIKLKQTRCTKYIKKMSAKEM